MSCFLNPLSPLSAVSVRMGVGPSAGTWVASQEPRPKKTNSPSVGGHRPFPAAPLLGLCPIHALALLGLILYRSYDTVVSLKTKTSSGIQIQWLVWGKHVGSLSHGGSDFH